MRIAIDISGIFAKSGLGNYIRLLIENLAKVGKENEYFLYTCFWRNFGQKIKELELPQQENFHLLSVRLPETAILFEEHVLELNLIERMLVKHKINVFHGPGNIIPNLKQIKSVLTIHHYYPSKKFYFKCTDFSIHKADHIIAISENTKKDLIREFNMDENRITVIYEGGPDKIYCQHNDIDQEVIKKYNLPQKYILFVGPINERKNLIA
jgi:glycosyltransferase involved in cell wall biosynthesis